MAQTRAADDFATIRARMEELRRERERRETGQTEAQSDPVMRSPTGRMGSLGLGRTGIADPAQSAARSKAGLSISA
jgi:hypothetical protein